MELQSQVASLQDELKLLKGEVKAILKEIRAAVLSGDNPFSAAAPATRAAPAARGLDAEPPPPAVAAQPAFAPPSGPVAAAPAPQAPAPTSPPAQAPPAPIPMPMQTPGPFASEAAGPAQPAPAAPIPTPMQTPGPFAPEAAAPAQPAQQPWPPREPSTSAAGERAVYQQHDEPARPPLRLAHSQPGPRSDERGLAHQPGERPPNLLAIASLAAWLEDALATMGARRLRMIIELAYCGELLSPEAREVLIGLADLPASDGDERPLSVNETLLVLRQLEAILHGEQVAGFPRRRGRRRRPS
jgi:hypothetical protein